VRYKIGEYYWIKVKELNSIWEICYCESIPYNKKDFPEGMGFVQIGVEGTAYSVPFIDKAIHIPYPKEDV